MLEKMLEKILKTHLKYGAVCARIFASGVIHHARVKIICITE